MPKLIMTDRGLIEVPGESNVVEGLTTTAAPITLTDAANVAINVSSNAFVYRLTTSGNRTLDPPTTTPSDGQRWLVCITASGADRTITPSAAGYLFPDSTIPSLTATLQNTMDIVGFLYDAVLAKTLIVSYIKGISVV